MAFSQLSAPKVTIEISDRQRHITIDPEVVQALAASVLNAEGRADATISLAFVDDLAIHEINRRHLQHDWPTDVITFRLSNPDDDVLEAELVISAEMAATTANRSGVDPQAELMLYVVHGLLHLCGYDDVNESDSLNMRRREDEVLRREGWANTFASIGTAGEITSWAD